MKMRSISALFAAGAACAAIAAAPAASAAPTGQTCTYVGSQTTQCQSPGNVQINSGTGDVTVLVPAGAYAIKIDTGLGDAHIDQGIVSDPLSTNVIRIDSGTGDVSLERSDV